MGYEALLFSPNEKLGRIITQVFTELDFTVEPAQEPFDAVKKLMSQRYDAIVVDCDNEQNAALLFKSARNSTLNQSSLAIALAEGQAGVAKAYRIGANLVLTKPINVEQAKGTLRVARGLLRKNSEAASDAATGGADLIMPAAVAPAPAINSSPPASKSLSANASTGTRRGISEFTSLTPATTAEASPDEIADLRPDTIPAALAALNASARGSTKAAFPEPPAPLRITSADELAVPARRLAPLRIVENDPGNNDGERPRSATVPAWPQTTRAASTSTGFAAATAPAKKVAAPAAKFGVKVASEAAAEVSYYSPPESAPSPSSAGLTDAPSFATLGKYGGSAGSGGTRRFLIVAVIVTALTALGYFGYGKIKTSNVPAPVPPPVSTPQDSGKPDSGQPAPALAPMSSPDPAPETATPDRADSATQSSSPGTVAASLPTRFLPANGNPPVIKLAIAPEAVEKKSDPTPLLVKSNRVGTPIHQSQEAAPPLSNQLSVGTANDAALSGLLASAKSNLPAAAPAVARVSQGVSQGLLIKRVQPKYPPAALVAHVQGAVQIEATINKEGNVTNPRVLKGNPLFARAALDAVRQWRYKPYSLDGVPVEIQTEITVNFKAN